MSRASRFSFVLASLLLLAGSALAAPPEDRPLRAGASAVDVTPVDLPVLVNGGFTERQSSEITDHLFCRAIVLDDGRERLVIAVVDSCMMPRDVIDRAKQMAHQATGIPTDRMMISATHSHTVPSVMRILGSRADPTYTQFLPGQIAKAVSLAVKNLEPARVGWGVVEAPEYVAARRWIFRSDHVGLDPFGERTVRATMHPGFDLTEDVGPAGPIDPDLSVLAVQAADGRPIALLANYSMHYFGSRGVSADYFGLFARKIEERLGAGDEKHPFVGILSNGTSGDMWRRDYEKPQRDITIDAYTEALVDLACDVYERIEFRDHAPLAMSQAELRLRRRVPDATRLAWAKEMDAKIGDRLPRTKPEVYAREAIYLHENPEAELILQAARIGDLALTAIPCEVYALTGLKLKTQSPLAQTINISLANGAEGYIPPPEQHVLGGYNTWPARSAGLEVEAETKIVKTVLGLLEDVAGEKRRVPVPPRGAYAQAVLASKPTAYWQLDEMDHSPAADEMNKHPGEYESGVVFYLKGPAGPGLDAGPHGSRAAHFAGGRMKTQLDKLPKTYSLELWFFNGMPGDARPAAGHLASLAPANQKHGDRLTVGGTATAPNKLVFASGDGEPLVGKQTIERRTWHHVVLVRDGDKVKVYLDGQPKPEIEGELPSLDAEGAVRLFLGGDAHNSANFEGKLDEAALYARALTAKEVGEHYAAATGTLPTSATRTPNPAPLSPAESLAAFHVRDGYRIELVACEPLVVDPVAIAWGADGKLWVVEMADYPSGLDGKGQPGGRIKYLEDTDGDGRYDRATLFLDGVNFPNGIVPWRDGVLVTAAPEVFYAADTDGDGRADVRKTLYRGFAEGNQQLRVNGLRRGLDNWLYLANGISGGKVQSLKTGEEVELGRRDLRIRPGDGAMDLLTGVSQYGRNRDDWGNWFGVQNSYPLYHYILEDRYLRRNPHYAAAAPLKYLVLPRNPPLFAATPSQKRYAGFDHTNRFTSACSTIIYRDELLFPRDGRLHAFTCDPFHNLIQHQVLTRDGVSFTARRDAEGDELDFLTSEDYWCRPVMVRTGPDGALWVVDMYRYMIEHPRWLPPEGKKELEPFYRSGDALGRIYRIVPDTGGGEGEKFASSPIPRIAQLSTEQLVAALDSPSGWQRDTAQQLLIERGDKAARPVLEKMATRDASPLARLHAFCALDGLDLLGPDALRTALADKHPGVRRHAIRLAEARAADDPALLDAVAKLADDEDAQVRLQLACSLGAWDGPRAAEALGKLALSDGNDVYIRGAILSSTGRDNIEPVLSAVLADGDAARGAVFQELLALAATLERNDLVKQSLQTLLPKKDQPVEPWRFAATARLLRVLQHHDTPLESVLDGGGDASARLDAVLAEARRVALDGKATSADREAAVGLLGLLPKHQEADREALAELLTPQTSPALQSAAVEQLALQKDAAAAGLLLAEWRGLGPMLRAQVVDVLCRRDVWLAALLDQLESGAIAPSEIDAAGRARIDAVKNKELRARAAKLLAETTNPDRQRVVEQYRAALELSGDATRGREVFKKNCAACHRFRGVGHQVGPDLAALTDKRPASLLTAILDPGRNVEGRYMNYLALTDDGRTFSGLLKYDTGTSLTLLGQEGREQVIRRDQLESLRGTRKSLMPEGLEQALTPQDVADLIAHLRER